MKRHMKSISTDDNKKIRKSQLPPKNSLALRSPALIQYLESLDRKLSSKRKKKIWGVLFLGPLHQGAVWMSIKHQVKNLYITQNFVQALYKSVNSYNARYGTDMSISDLDARRTAEKWRAILTSNYEFQEGNFSILIEEIFGELLHEMISVSPFSPLEQSLLIRKTLSKPV